MFPCIAKGGGIAICAPIAPYAATRRAVRDMIASVGGFIEIQGGVVTILADTALRAEDLDEAQAQAAAEAAEKARADSAADVDFSVVAAQVAEARAQQRTIEELRRLKGRA